VGPRWHVRLHSVGCPRDLLPSRVIIRAHAATERMGLIAILDALGAATYSDPEIDLFLESRDLVLERLKINQRAEAGQIDKARLRLFTFNDTVVIVYLAAKGGSNSQRQ
jgi:hypothetical protein